jgi:hypothetical protein
LDNASQREAPSTTTELEEHQFCSAPRATSATGIAPWGPWSPAIDAGERRCQLRCLSGLIAAYRGSADPLISVLRSAESDDAVLQDAAVQFDRLPTRVLRNVVSIFGAIMRPRRAPQ